VGFTVVERLATRWGLRWGPERFRALVAEGRAPVGPSPGSPGPRVAALLPQTHMNDVGRSVGPARGAYRVALDRVLVVHDDIDLPFGEVRTRIGGGLAGHNGLKSLKRELGGGDFRRVRVGVGRPDSTDPEIVSAWVLGRFRESRDRVEELIERACSDVEAVLVEGLAGSGSSGEALGGSEDDAAQEAR